MKTAIKKMTSAKGKLAELAIMREADNEEWNEDITEKKYSTITNYLNIDRVVAIETSLDLYTEKNNGRKNNGKMGEVMNFKVLKCKKVTKPNIENEGEGMESMFDWNGSE